MIPVRGSVAIRRAKYLEEQGASRKSSVDVQVYFTSLLTLVHTIHREAGQPFEHATREEKTGSAAHKLSSQVPVRHWYQDVRPCSKEEEVRGRVSRAPYLLSKPTVPDKRFCLRRAAKLKLEWDSWLRAALELPDLEHLTLEAPTVTRIFKAKRQIYGGSSSKGEEEIVLVSHMTVRRLLSELTPPGQNSLYRIRRMHRMRRRCATTTTLRLVKGPCKISIWRKKCRSLVQKPSL